MHFCYECGASGEEWKRTHFSIPNPSKYRCPPTEKRRAREGFTKDEADRHETQRLMEARNTQSLAQDRYRSMLRVCRAHLLGCPTAAGSSGAMGAVEMRRRALLRSAGGGRAPTMLTFMVRVARECLRSLSVLMWCPVYLYSTFSVIPGSRAGAREIALVNNSSDAHARQVLSLVRLLAAADADGFRAVSRLFEERLPGREGAASEPTRVSSDFCTSSGEDAAVGGQTFNEWRETVITKCETLKTRRENLVVMARETRLDGIVDVQERKKDALRWAAAEVWLQRRAEGFAHAGGSARGGAAAGGANGAAAATKTGGVLSRIFGRGANKSGAASKSGDGGRASKTDERAASKEADPQWVTQLRALELEHPTHPWEAQVAEEQGPQPVWWWSGVGGSWTPYSCEAQDTLETAHSDMAKRGGSSAHCEVVSAGNAYQITVCSVSAYAPAAFRVACIGCATTPVGSRAPF